MLQSLVPPQGSTAVVARGSTGELSSAMGYPFDRPSFRSVPRLLRHQLAPAITAVAVVAAAVIVLRWQEHTPIPRQTSSADVERSSGVRVTRFGTGAEAAHSRTTGLGRTAGSPNIRVVDGDTIDAVVQPSREWRRYRLVGFDTPETYYARCDAERALGYEAARRLGELVRTGEVQLYVQEGARDRYSRGLATVRVDGEDIGQILIREGLAVSYLGRVQRIDWCAKLAGR